MSTPSPLGRYAPAASGPPSDVVRVQLLGVPVRVLAAAREHHDNVMREFRLLALSGGLDAGSAPARLVELTRVLGVQYGASQARPDAVVDDALDRGDDTVDLAYDVPAQVAAQAQVLDALMAEADEYCSTEQLLTVQRSPTIAEFGAWYLQQFVHQCAGGAATPWQGPLDPV